MEVSWSSDELHKNSNYIVVGLIYCKDNIGSDLSRTVFFSVIMPGITSTRGAMHFTKQFWRFFTV